ncbi:MAG: zinc-ribbon domain-containing protein [Chloroflexi bacterium]|nr:MAG: zinc-ribbon domain-containing protein [Chloroflexota bacterium]
MTLACPTCATENPAGNRFCSNCGTELSASCRRCGAPIPVGARFCPNCGEPVEAEAGPEERKIATVVFIDLVDSTRLGELLDPERLRSILQAYFSLVSTTVQAWGGTVEKFIGDAAVGVFGVPRVREDDAARALSAASEIVGRIGGVAADVQRRHGVDLALRIGVNTGEVITPTEVRPDRPMVTGDAINVAARLQAAAEPGSVLVGERTQHATRTAFAFGEPAELHLKGKEQPVVAYPLIGPIAGAVEAGPARNLQARVVGRDRELSIVETLLDEVVEGRMPRLAMVYGDAGVGKSRLVAEVVARAGTERGDLQVLRGRCPAIGQGVTYWPLAEIVRGACGISLDEAADEAQAKLKTRAGELLSAAGLSATDVEGTIYALATTAGIALPDNPLDRSRPVAVVTELARRWPQFLSACAVAGPVAVVIEDLHWASDQVVAMVERLVSRATGPMLLLATARPTFAEAHPSFASGLSEATSVSLRPLSRAHSTELIADLLAATELPEPMRDQILDTAEGNPLFVEEIVSRLIEAGALRLHEGRWRAEGDGHAVVLPDTINGLLTARIDALPEIERRVLREASVVGRIFWEEPLVNAVGGQQVATELDGLERRGLILMRPTSSLGDNVEYAFKHALIRDVAYAGLPIARRCRAHAAVGAWLAELSHDRPEELAELVAQHYRTALGEGAVLAWPDAGDELAEVRRRARLAFLAGGAAARKRFAIDQAAELHQLAADLATDDDERATALEELGDDYDAGYDGDHSVPAWEQAIALRQTLPDAGAAVPRMAMKAARMGAVRWGGFSTPMEPDAIDRHVETGLAAAPDAATRAWLLMLRAAAGLRWVAFHRTDPVDLEERVRGGEAAAKYARDSGDESLLANALRMVGALLMANEDVARGLEVMKPILAMAPQIADPRERHLMTIETANSFAWSGGQAEAMIPVLEEALLLGRELRVHDLCHSTSTLMNALYLAGRWEEIPGYLDEHIRTFRIDEAGTTCPFALGGFQLGAVVLAQRGEMERAQELAGEMPKSEAPVGLVEGLQAMAANALGDPSSGRSMAERVLATGARNFAEEPPVEMVAMLDALVALEDWDALRAFLPEARRRAAELVLVGPSTDRAEGLAAGAGGDIPRAQELLQAAIAGFEPISPFETARTREALASLNPDHRDELLTEALAAYERLGARPHADRVRALIPA